MTGQTPSASALDDIWYSFDEVRRIRVERQRARALEAVARTGGRIPLQEYIGLAWDVVEPSRKYKQGWAIDAVADHLTAVSNNQVNRLLINVPPGMMKSLTSCVFWPSWEWGPNAMPSLRILGFSYDMDLSTRDAVRCRRLIQSDWYQSVWGNSFSLSGDQSTKTRYENDKTGWRISDYVGGGTGERGDRDIVDDPHQVKDPESDAMRQRATLWLTETLPSRLNDPEESAIVIIHHRLHEQDMSGVILASDLGYTHLMLPMEFDPKRRCTTSIGFRDPRTEEGELLFPERFSREVVERDKKAMSAYAVAGQFQQDPIPRGGIMFKRDWFEIVGAAPADCHWVRYWDLAATMDGGAYTAGSLVGRSRSTGMFYVRDVRRAQLDGNGVKRLIAQTAALDTMLLGRRNYSIWLPQDPGQAGKVQAKDFINLLAGYDAHTEIESGDKVTRADPFAAQAEAGNVKLVEGDWIPAYLDELVTFPTGKYKDQVDASSGAFGSLIMHPKKLMLVGTVRGNY